jgi:predicted adenylyl cyclase CyaB
MARNIEIKARIESVESLLQRVAAIADQGPTGMIQDDTFFSCPNGRLKLRTFSDTEGQLIFYRRPDQAGPKESLYVISPTATPSSLREALTLACGQAGRVRKHRTVFMVGRTRVHLDKVERLGHFLELEVVLAEGEATEAGVEVARELLECLGISRLQLIAEAYVDLLASQSSDCPRDSK